jgi:16S rRNA (guanine527-N7)-methyltransferase
LFHVEHVVAAARYSGLDLDDAQFDSLRAFRDWLRDEGIRTGGIGPEESSRIERRHLADSLLFASEMPAGVEEVWDLGTGVGLPGIPLAIALPATRFLLIDRSRRRIELLRRVVRILDLDNCQVELTEITELSGRAQTLVARASMPPSELRPVVASLLAPGGAAIVAGSWRERPEPEGWTTVEIPRYVLDQTIWLLIMRPA